MMTSISISIPVALLLLFTVTNCNGLYRPNILPLKNAVTQDTVTGNNLVFIYQRNEDIYYFKESEATEGYEGHGIYDFTVNSDADDEGVSIRISEGKYLHVENEALTTSETAESFFRMTPVGDSKTKFTLQLYPGLEDLVTPFSSQPFKFFLSSRYPDEPLAEFEIAEMTVEEYYQNSRDNINKTLEYIHTSSIIEKNAAYMNLVNLMQNNGHSDGSEIFTVGRNILQDIGESSAAFNWLPLLVRNTLGGGGFRLVYEQYTPMKYSWASNSHENILPYTITQHNETGLWALTYSSGTQLNVNSNEDLVDFVSDTKEFVFQLRMVTVSAVNTIQFFIHSYSSDQESDFHPLIVKPDSDGSNYYFKLQVDGSGLTQGANFAIIPY